MTRSAFVIVTVADRVSDLNNLLESLAALADHDGEQRPVYILFQGPRRDADRVKLGRLAARTVLWRSPERLGCHAARVLLLRQIMAAPKPPDVFINMDDDMEVIPGLTRYAGAIEKALDPMTGFVLTNWAKTRELVERKVPKMREAFVKQALVYQGGGMVYRREVAEMMAALPAIPQTFDHCWPLTAYVNGLTNYRYLGSLAIHRVCGRGGMQAYMTDNAPAALMQEYVTFRRAKIQRGNGLDLLLPMDEDLLPLAIETHMASRARRQAAIA